MLGEIRVRVVSSLDRSCQSRFEESLVAQLLSGDIDREPDDLCEERDGLFSAEIRVRRRRVSVGQ